MKTVAWIFFLIILCSKIFAQCPFDVTLKTTGHCLGDTLTVSTNDSLYKLTWYNGNAVDSIVKPIDLGITGYTVAGGHGNGAGSSQFNGPYGIFVDSAGNIYVADDYNNRIQKWASGSGTGITVAGGNGGGSDSNQLLAPEGIFVDKSGNMWIADLGNNRVQKWAPGSITGETVAGGNGQGTAANQLTLPYSVFVDANGYLYVDDSGNGRVQKFPPGSTGATNGVTVAGFGTTVTSHSGPNQLSGPLGIFVDGNGNLYIADQGNQRIEEYTPGSMVGITVAGGNGRGDASNQLDCPNGVYVDSKGNVFVSDGCANRVQEWVPGADSGITVAGGNGPGSGPDQLEKPDAVFVNDSGIVYVSDYSNDRVQKFAHHYKIDTTLVPTVPGTYTAVVTNSNGCTVTTNAVVINPTPVVSSTISTPAAEICAGSLITFNSTTSNAGSAPFYQWQVNGNNKGTDSNIFADDSLQTGDSISCIVTSSLVCALPVASNIITVTVQPAPTVFAGRDTILAPGSTIQLDPMVTGTITNYAWSPATGLSDPTIPRPFATPAVSTTYQLTVVADNGCSDSSEIKIFIYHALQMPNAFTPNGDGKNDVFRIPPASAIRLINFAVYDRWGNNVFATKNTGIGWDGDFKNQKQPAGTYVWEIQYYDLFSGKPEKAKGTVVLIR